MPDFERALRDKARAKLREGTLPLVKPSRTWGGPGASLTCAVCDLSIGKDQIEFEVQFVLARVARPAVFHFHLACFSAWELERGLLVRKSGIS